MPAFQNPFRRTSDGAEPVEEPTASAPDADADSLEPVVGSPDLVDDDEGEWLAYELHEWASESRAMLAQLLVAEEVVHSWQGTTLLAHESVEEAVDALLDEVEAADNPELDPEKPQTGFEMAEWSGELQALLAERLGQVGLPHQFDADGDLVVHEEDEEQVELIIDDLLARVADEDLEELEGLAVNDLLSSMFTATDRLRRDAHDGPAVLAALDHGRRIAGVATPFGFTTTSWSELRDQCGDLIELLSGEHADDDDIVDLAARLRDSLQRVI